ncbi:hypothetical protein DL96DRAFT_1561148 [Flagelloscypha sp. PMI_526]|nr:hypothetical protein DL96DRAFT_1561148 [Flagelloscypha sp. PMI_526]
MDGDFWYDNRLKVEKRLFRVPVGALMEQSEFFNDMLNDGSPGIDADNGQEGGSERFPIVISDETARAFSLLLKWVYKRGTNDWTQDDWVECARIAHKFRVPSLTAAAMEFITKSKMDPATLIGLCVIYQLDWSWARNAIADLCNQYKPFPRITDHGVAIPPQLCLEIWEVRDVLWKRRCGQTYPIYCNGCKDTRSSVCGRCGEDQMSLLPMGSMDMALVDKILDNMK